ncbi:MAG TPA: SH3 domain-containing protein [Feifaniaceae bacterium]|nr:SH3 domain-containing protein [Feifaniaceae bacterium]
MQISKNTVKRPVSLLLFAILLIGVYPLTALAASREYVAVTDLNVRLGPGTQYNIIGVLHRDQVIERLGTSGNWTKFLFNGQTAYVSSLYIRPRTQTDGEGAMQATANVNVRSGPGTSYSKLGQLKKEDTVMRVGSTGDWTIIEWKDGRAYVSSGYLRLISPAQAAGSRFFALPNARLRSGMGSGYTILTTFSEGASLKGKLRADGWLEIDWSTYGTNIKVLTGYLPPQEFASLPQGFTAASGNRYLKKDAFIYAATGVRPVVATELRQGHLVQRIAAKGDWVLIEYLNASYASMSTDLYGYVKASDLAGEPVASSSRNARYVKELSWEVGMRIPIFAGPGTQYERVTEVVPRQTVIATGRVEGSWTQVSANGYTGYILTKYLSTSPVW